MLELVGRDNPVLYRVAPHYDGDPARLEVLARRLHEIMSRPAMPGYGIAAPQVGESVRLFVLDSCRLDMRRFEHAIVCVNAEIEEASPKLVTAEERCLTRLSYERMVTRPKWICAAWTDLAGRRIRRRLTGLMARGFQHELDHLNGKCLWPEPWRAAA